MRGFVVARRLTVHGVVGYSRLTHGFPAGADEVRATPSVATTPGRGCARVATP